MRVLRRRAQEVSTFVTYRTLTVAQRPAPRAWLPARLMHPFAAAAVLLCVTALLMIAGTLWSHPHVHLDIGGGNDDRALVFFGLPEQDAANTFRWTYPQARLFLYGLDGRPALLELRAASLGPQDAAPATLMPTVQGQAFGPFTVARQFRRYHVLIPGNPTQETVVALQGSFFSRSSSDPRELGVAMSDLNAALVGSPLWAWTRMLFLLTLPLLGWLLVWRLGGAAWLSFAVGLALACGACVAAAFPIAAGYWLPLVWWPWWPLLPLLGLVAAPPAVRWLGGRVPWSPWVGMAIIIAGLLLVRLGGAAWPGMVLALAGVLVALADVPREAAWSPETVRPAWLSGERLALIAITAVALALRLYHLDTLPIGMWRDEARHGLAALRIWTDPTYRPVYVVDKADLPALLFYLMAPIIGTFGPHVWSERLVSAVAGGLTPLALWWAVRPIFGARAAVLGAALLAWASWSLSMSRWGFPATLDQLFTLTAVGVMWRALDRDRGRAWRIGGMAAAGLCAGLAAYTYHTGRFTPLILAVLTMFRLGWSRAAWRRAVPGIAAALLVGMLTLLPLLQFIARDFAGYSRRVDMVALLSSNDLDLRSPVSLLERNFSTYLLMWHVHGERNGRHHAPNAPMLDPLAGALLLVGAGLVLRWWRQPRMPMMLAWIGLALLPGLFSTDAPHAMRSLPTLAPAIILAAVGLDALLHGGHARLPARRLVTGLVAGAFMLSLAFNTWLYFVTMRNDPRVYNEFEPPLTAMAHVASAPFQTSDPALQQVRVFLPVKVMLKDPVRFLCANLPVGLYGSNSLASPPGNEALLLLPPDASPADQAAALKALGPGAHALPRVPVDPGGQPLFLAYSLGTRGEQLIHAALPQFDWGAAQQTQSQPVQSEDGS